MDQPIETSVLINSSLDNVWEYLTNPALIKQWMGEPELAIEITTDWVVGNPIVITGFHHVKFENKGRVLQLEPQKMIRYSHLSSVSRLPDVPENYSVITFQLTPEGDQTILKVTAENFPTETIYKHLDFYWKGTVFIIKNNVEEGRKHSSLA